MRTRFIGPRSVALLAALGLGALLAAAPSQAQTLHVAGTNALGSHVYDVNFSGSGGTITQINSDARLLQVPVSLVYVPNPGNGSNPGTIDLLVADALSGKIVRYANVTASPPPPPEASTLVWSRTSGPGPTFPDGMSVDANGNLYVVNSPILASKPAELWVFPALSPAGSGFGAPRLLDNGFNNTFEHRLAETLVSATANGATGTGDLLVLANSPTPAVYFYSAQDIQNFLSLPYCNPTTTTCPTVSAHTLIASLPAGVNPSGMDFWPPDNSLLIANEEGSILRYGLNGGVVPMTDFADGAGDGLQKLKTGVQAGVPYAFVAKNQGAAILEFGAPPGSGANPPLAQVTTGVVDPVGLAVSNLNAALAKSCLQTNGGCDLLGGVIPHAIIGTPMGSNSLVNQSLIESPCIVSVDPRWSQNPPGTGPWVYNPVPLPVSQVCAGYGGTVIPTYLAGGSGPTLHGFALVKNANNADSNLKGTLVQSAAFVNTLLPNPNNGNPTCPQTVVGWAPLEAEGSLLATDPLSPQAARPLLENTTFCGSSGAHSSGMSIFAIGLVLYQNFFYDGADDSFPSNTDPDDNPYALFAASKYTGLFNAVNATGIMTASMNSLLTSCIQTSLNDFNSAGAQQMNPARYANAAYDLIQCDADAGNESSFYATASAPNPSGEIRGRIRNLYLTINYFLAGQGTVTPWTPTGP